MVLVSFIPKFLVIFPLKYGKKLGSRTSLPFSASVAVGKTALATFVASAGEGLKDRGSNIDPKMRGPKCGFPIPQKTEVYSWETHLYMEVSHFKMCDCQRVFGFPQSASVVVQFLNSWFSSVSRNDIYYIILYYIILSYHIILYYIELYYIIYMYISYIKYIVLYYMILYYIIYIYRLYVYNIYIYIFIYLFIL